ncbi:unnamed protein product, partial [Protopolystoma xenopodis]
QPLDKLPTRTAIIRKERNDQPQSPEVVRTGSTAANKLPESSTPSPSHLEAANSVPLQHSAVSSPVSTTSPPQLIHRLPAEQVWKQFTEACWVIYRKSRLPSKLSERLPDQLAMAFWNLFIASAYTEHFLPEELRNDEEDTEEAQKLESLMKDEIPGKTSNEGAGKCKIAPYSEKDQLDKKHPLEPAKSEALKSDGKLEEKKPVEIKDPQQAEKREIDPGQGNQKVADTNKSKQAKSSCCKVSIPPIRIPVLMEKTELICLLSQIAENLSLMSGNSHSINSTLQDLANGATMKERYKRDSSQEDSMQNKEGEKNS